MAKKRITVNLLADRLDQVSARLDQVSARLNQVAATLGLNERHRVAEVLEQTCGPGADLHDLTPQGPRGAPETDDKGLGSGRPDWRLHVR